MRCPKVGDYIKFRNGWYLTKTSFRVVEIVPQERSLIDKVVFGEGIVVKVIIELKNKCDSHIIYGWEEEGDEKHRLYWNVVSTQITEINSGMEMIQVE